ncbi:MAG: hypothetical protein HOA57_00345 [Candidatus Magasanikbacteria bacterium]|jgi:hypothetical protein|nr:hypothetical protein [Candidatus Magasanikbacteria bacterium]MBT4314797.1 hypothetical protein [Candidatus Magasanikbacteria bacterium]MBT4547574.1 hypothetical protein [Candidatus Magasanikbacteria bacterium]MBT6818823.1 hypothetical protein [Candidatus Magasanikbacteria bacterium]
MKKNQVFLCLILFTCVFGGVFRVLAVEEPYVRINKGSLSTQARKVNLYLKGPENVKEMRISNIADFSGSNWESFKTSKVWYLEYGSGYQTVYVRFKTKDNDISGIYRDYILLSSPINMSVDFEIVDDGGDDEESDGIVDSRYIQLNLDWSPGVEKIRISNSNDFSDSSWLWIEDTAAWILTAETGDKEVFVQFKDIRGETKTIKKEIRYEQPGYYISEGTLLKGQVSTVYYLGYDGRIHPFFNGAIYHSWHENFDKIQYVSNSKLSQYKVGSPVCVRQGTWLVKFKSLPHVYAVEPGCQLRLLRSEAEASLIYGVNWSNRILELDLVLKSYYKVNYPHYLLGEDEDYTDSDKDGVEDSTEDVYGSSDHNKDTDSDGLSDYEEIFYWFSDPVDDDSDNDGFKDGVEVVSGFSPVGVSAITEAGAGTYEYAKGTLVRKNNKYYYRDHEGSYRYVSSKSSDKRFKSNNFQAKFIVKSPITVPFSNSGNVSMGDQKISIPQRVSKEGNLSNL